MKSPHPALSPFLLAALMAEHARLMRAGDLMGATSAIQRALGGLPARVRVRASSRFSFGRLIRPFQADALDALDIPAASDAPPRHAALGGQGPSFVSGSYANSASRLDYKLFIPASAGSRPLPLVVMLHGCSQNPDDFAAGTAMNRLAASEDFFVLYPAQPRKSNPQGCWNWFKHTHQGPSRGEPALIAGATRAVIAEHAIDPDRVFAAGLSAGGSMAAILGTTHPELYSAVGVHSGIAAGAAANLVSAMGAMRGGAQGPLSPSPTPAIVFHGDADQTVHPRNGSQAASAASAGASAEITEIPDANGRSATRSVFRSPDGRVLAEHWLSRGSGHAWSGGDAAGSYADELGPNASAEMFRFFMEHPRAAAGS